MYILVKRGQKRSMSLTTNILNPFLSSMFSFLNVDVTPIHEAQLAAPEHECDWKPETFDFLSFMHISGKNGNGGTFLM